jgi:hypothetical protein
MSRRARNALTLKTIRPFDDCVHSRLNRLWRWALLTKVRATSDGKDKMSGSALSEHSKLIGDEFRSYEVHLS